MDIVLGQCPSMSLEELFNTIGKAETTPRSCEPEVWLMLLYWETANLQDVVGY
jgi:hypothetical protein